MRDIIQSGGESVQEWFSKAGGRVSSVFRRGGQQPENEGQAAAVATESPAGMGDAPARERPDGGRVLRDFLDLSQRTFEEWQKRVDERLRQALESISPLAGLQKEIAGLGARIADLERRVSELVPGADGETRGPER
jgi:hypothetical protein